MSSSVVQLGPFDIGARLGEGGMGTVYGGRHRETGVPVAIKVIRHLGNERSRYFFHREVQAHAGLQHPGIVYLFEYGAVGEQAARSSEGRWNRDSPFIAMERAEGGTLRDLLPFSSWAEVRHVLVPILDALAHAHARGVIHRDLKPENVLVFPDDSSSDAPATIKLADFGIAHAFRQLDESETESLPTFVGTPHYMAPEQVRGDWRALGPWTDLYALGCFVFELVCGRPPFLGATPVGVALKQVSEKRPPLEPLFAVPAPLAGWIEQAMAIDAQKRFRRAADALRALPTVAARPLLYPSAPVNAAHPVGESLIETQILSLTKTTPYTLAPTLLDLPPARVNENNDAQDAPYDAVPCPPVFAHWRPRYKASLPAPLVGTGLGLFGLREAPFVNRDETCAQIWSALTQVAKTNALRFAFVSGPAGTGKSRLASWIAIRAHEIGAASVLRVVHSSGGGSADGLAAALQRHFCTANLDREALYHRLRRTLPPLGSDGPQGLDRDARALTEYLRPGDDESDGKGPRYHFASARHRQGFLVRVLRRLALRRPLLLWLDDLQWGEEALGLLEFLREPQPDSPPVLALATLRSDIVSESPSLHQRLEAFCTTGAASFLSLSPLAQHYQRELLLGLLPLEPELADQLALRTEGHPLFAMQLLAHWIDSGLLETSPDGFRLPTGLDVSLPQDIHALWTARIERLVQLYPAERAEQIQQALELAAVLGRDVVDTEWSQALLDAALKPPSDLIARLIGRGLAERNSQGWSFAHGFLVESLLRQAGQRGRLTKHHRHCARALSFTASLQLPGSLERIANHWIEAGDPQRALEPLLQEIRLADQRADYVYRGRLLAQRADLLKRLPLSADDPERLEQSLEEARHRLNQRQPPEEVAQTLATLWERTDPEHYELQGRIAHQLGQVYYVLGDDVQAEAWAKNGLQTSQRPGAEQVCSRLWRLRAEICRIQGRLPEAQTHIASAQQLAEKADDFYEALCARDCLAYIHLASDSDDVDALFQRNRQEAAEAGYCRIEAISLNGLGEHARLKGDLAEARRYYGEYVARMREFSHLLDQVIGTLNLAMVELSAAEFAQAYAHLLAAEKLISLIGNDEMFSPLRRLIRLAHAAGKCDQEAFARHWSPFEKGWRRDCPPEADYPWLLEIAARHALTAGWTEAAEQTLRLAGDLWEQLDDEKGARRVQALLSRLG